MKNKEEIFDLVNEGGAVIGSATRSQCHSDNSLLHPVAHVVVMNSKGEMLLQKRSPDKDIQPDKWDTSVGGHISSGEDPLIAAVRETAEEIGYTAKSEEFSFCYSYIMKNEIESELVYSYYLECDGPFTPQPEEISELRFWTIDEIKANMDSDVFAPNFRDEFRHFMNWKFENS